MAELDQFQEIVQKDLSDKIPEYCQGIHIDGPSIYPDPSIEDSIRNLVLVPVHYDHYIFKGSREGRHPILGTPIEGGPDSCFPNFVSLGCDYMLNKNGQILIAPESVELRGRIRIIEQSQ